MNTTEDLLRAAMHETAAEVAPGTVAPLSLPESARPSSPASAGPAAARIRPAAGAAR